MGCLYRIVFPNGKAYIGMTVADPHKRFWEHENNAKRGLNLPLYEAMRAFGSTSAKKEILVMSYDREYLALLERAAIKAFNTKKPNGYNLTDGGDGAPIGNKYNLGKKRTPETRAKMSASRKGKVLSATARANISSGLRGNKYSLGFKHSIQVKERMAAAQRGRAKLNSAVGTAGVSIDRQTGKYRAHLTINHKMIHLGRFDTIAEALAARLAGERKHFQVAQ